MRCIWGLDIMTCNKTKQAIQIIHFMSFPTFKQLWCTTAMLRSVKLHFASILLWMRWHEYLSEKMEGTDLTWERGRNGDECQCTEPRKIFHVRYPNVPIISTRKDHNQQLNEWWSSLPGAPWAQKRHRSVKSQMNVSAAPLGLGDTLNLTTHPFAYTTCCLVNVS